MPRELNNELFGSTSRPSEASSTHLPPVKGAPGSQIEMSNNKLVNELVLQLKALQRRVKELEGRQEQTKGHFEEIAKATKLRFERVQAYQKNIETQMKTHLQEYSNRLSNLNSKLTERRVSDAKLEEMMNRHNNVVHNFELKLKQMQKVISEQEYKLMSLK